jgi:hypothetical protein
MLRISFFYHKAREHYLFSVQYNQDNFDLYPISDKGDPLLLRLQTPYRELHVGRRLVVENLFNCKSSQGHPVVDNAFRILKQAF